MGCLLITVFSADHVPYFYLYIWIFYCENWEAKIAGLLGANSRSLILVELRRNYLWGAKLSRPFVPLWNLRSAFPRVTRQNAPIVNDFGIFPIRAADTDGFWCRLFEHQVYVVATYHDISTWKNINTTLMEQGAWRYAAKFRVWITKNFFGEKFNVETLTKT